MKGECLGYCGDTNAKLYDDMMVPPMSMEECLCRNCAQAHAEEAIEELELNIQEIKDFIEEKLV